MKYLQYILIFVLLVFGIVALLISTDPVIDEKSAIETTLLRGGLAELPSHTGLHIEQLGSSFTREFVIEFYTDAGSIDDRVKSSKRLRDSLPFIDGNTVRYDISPGEGGALGGTVNIDTKRNYVRIDMSWS